MAKSLTAQLEPYGAPPEAVVTLTESSPDQIRYLDLLSRPGTTAPRPSAVVEMQGRPVMYVAERTDALELGPLRRALALRADGSFLGVIEPGRLTIYTLGVGETGDQELRSVRSDDVAARTVIPELALLPPIGESSSAEVRDLLFRLLDQASTDLERVGVSPDDALSLFDFWLIVESCARWRRRRSAPGFEISRKHFPRERESPELRCGSAGRSMAIFCR
ncbi:MAG: hypothetical protein ABI779_18615 [Acidobacteriota bacterium]